MFNILKLNKIAAEGLAVFPSNNYEINTESNYPEGIILRSFEMAEMELAPTLLAVARAGAGVNNIPVPKCSERGIVVFNTPGANANAVKELTIAGLLLASRGVIDGINFSQSLKGKGNDVPKLVEDGKKNYGGIEIAGKTLGVIGLGKIGVMVANAAADLDMRVIGYDPFISVESAWGLSRDVKRATSLDNLIAASDYITLHTPLSDATKNMINAERLNRMKKGIKILNFSRGGIINNNDLSQAIKAGKVSKYVTDFPDAQLLEMENVINIPHLGASTEEAETNCAIMAAQQLCSFLEYGNIKNSVNYPDMYVDSASNFRLTVMNKNIPNMVGQISTILAKANINIVEMLNKSKGEYAYNIIDISTQPSEESLNAIAAIQGVIKVRVIIIT